MTVRRRLLPAAVFLLAAYSLPAAAFNEQSSCEGTGNTRFQMNSINWHSGMLPKPGTLIYTSPYYTVNYRCTTQLDSQLKFEPTLQILGDFQSAITALDRTGLKLDISMTETGHSPVTWYWYEMKGGPNTKPFGASMGSNQTNVNRSVTFQLKLYVDKQINSAQIVDVGSLTAFSIIPCTSCTTVQGVHLTSTPFSIRYMPSNFGYVRISPTTVNLGHIYTNYQNPEKRATFTVRAGQNLGVGGPDGKFTIPLQVTFTTGKVLTDSNHAALMTSDDDGQPNGLTLSILNDAGNTLEFGKPSDLGALVSGDTGIIATPVEKNYTALLKESGGPLKTGPFSADVTVTVTYN
ncbi:fimbrial protein [Salmonella enterica subsp. enterica serovar Morehead]|nr:fimbrial protein [Salmonella enterica subsp. enterica serovar Morehead]